MGKPIMVLYLSFLGLQSAFVWARGSGSYQELFLKGIKAYEAGKYKEATFFMDSVLKLKPQYVKALFIRGRSYLELNEYNLALDDFLETTNLDPYNAEYYYYTARCEWRLGRPKTAIETLEKVLEYDPNHPEAYQTLGDLYFELRMYNKAKEYFDKAVSLNPKLDLKNKQNLKDHITDDFKYALHEFSQEIQREPHNPLPLFNRGLLYELSGKNTDALKDFDACLSIDSTFKIVYFYKAQIHKKVKNYVLAEKELNSYLRFFPADKKALLLAAEIKKLQGKK